MAYDTPSSIYRNISLSNDASVQKIFIDRNNFYINF